MKNMCIRKWQVIGFSISCAAGGFAHATVFTPYANGSLQHTAGTATGTEITTDSLQCATANQPQSYCNDAFKIDWSVLQGDDNTWQYTYTLAPLTTAALRPALSHWIVQVSDSFTDTNILGGSSNGAAAILDQYGPGTQGNSNTGIPSLINGIKWNFSNVGSPSVSLITDRMPVWGNIYLKGGQGPYAYNTQWFGAANGTAVLAGSDLDGYIARPDSVSGGSGGSDPLPNPSIALMTLLGLGILRTRKK